MTAGDNPLANKTHRKPGDAKRKIIGTPNYSATPQLHQDISPIKPATRSKSGCMTCRIRRKKCDLEREGDSCKTCARLRIQCLGWGAKRPDALRDPAVVKECQHMIKVFLASNNMIKGSARSAVPQPGQPQPPFLKLTSVLKTSPPTLESCASIDARRSPRQHYQLPPLIPAAPVAGSQYHRQLPSLLAVVNPGSPSSSSSANAGGGGAGDAGQPSYLNGNFLRFDNLKRDDLGNLQAQEAAADRAKGRPAPRKSKARGHAPAISSATVDDEDADGSVEEYDESGDYVMGESETVSSYSKHSMPPYPPPPPVGYDHQYGGRHNPYLGHHTGQYLSPNPYTQSALRTGSHDAEKRAGDDGFRDLERDRERELEQYHRAGGFPPTAPGTTYQYPPPGPVAYRPELVYGSGVTITAGMPPYGPQAYRDPLAAERFSNNVLPPLNSSFMPPRFQISPPDTTLKPVTQGSLSVSPSLPMIRTPSHQSSENFSAQNSPQLPSARAASVNGRYRSTSGGGRIVSGALYPGGEVEADVDGEPMPQSQSTTINPFLPLGSSFGPMYAFDAQYTDAELGVTPTSALVATMGNSIMDVAGSMDTREFVATMTAIGMNDSTDLANLKPSAITTLEHFHQQLSSPAQVVGPMPFFNVCSPEDKQLNKQLDLLYMYRWKLCNLQYHIAHSTDASIADELFDFAMSSQSALYGTLTLTSLFKLMTRDTDGGPMEEALQEMQYFKGQVAKRLSDQMRDPSQVDSGDAMAGLHMVSAILFEGGTSSQWEKFLNVARTWVQNHQVAKTKYAMMEAVGGESNALLSPSSVIKHLDKKSLFIVKATAWFDVIGSVTARKKPSFLTMYRELFGQEGGAAMEQIMGCDDKVLLAIAETAALAEWRQVQHRKNQLSLMALANRASTIQPLLDFIGPVYSGHGFIIDEDSSPSPGSTVDEVDVILGTAHGSPSSTSSKTPAQGKVEKAQAAHHIRLVSNVFRAAGKLYLHTVVSGCNPDVKEIKDAVAETVTAFEHLEASKTDRSLVFPIALAGCMTDNLEYRTYLISRLKTLGTEGEAVGNTRSCLTLMEAVWAKRDTGATRYVDWIDTMKEMGWSLLLA